MKLVMTLLCRDEVDIIDHTLQFHLSRGVDLIIATDNGSTDGSSERLAHWQALCPSRVQLLHEPEHCHDQARWVSRMATIAYQEHQADWIIHSDADEFWWHSSPDLHDAFANVAADVQALHVTRSNFLPPPHDTNEAEPFYRRQTLRERHSTNSLAQALPPKVCHRGCSDAWVEDGNHAVRIGGQPATTAAVQHLEILHFPVRSYHQYERKIRQGAEALQRNSRISSAIGSTWREVYNQHLQRGRLAEHYAELVRSSSNRKRCLAAGELLVDERLRNFFEQQSHGPIR